MNELIFVDYLATEGNPNVQTVDGETPLHIAVIWNRALIVEMLLVSRSLLSHVHKLMKIFFQ